MEWSYKGSRSLIVPANPKLTIEQQQMSIAQARVHAGLEDIDDLIDDLGGKASID